MGDRSKFDKAVEYYKCIMLTVIAIILLFIFLRTPIPFTIKNLQNKRVEVTEMPIVKAQ